MQQPGPKSRRFIGGRLRLMRTPRYREHSCARQGESCNSASATKCKDGRLPSEKEEIETHGTSQHDLLRQRFWGSVMESTPSPGADRDGARVLIQLQSHCRADKRIRHTVDDFCFCKIRTENCRCLDCSDGLRGPVPLWSSVLSRKGRALQHCSRCEIPV